MGSRFFATSRITTQGMIPHWNLEQPNNSGDRRHPSSPTHPDLTYGVAALLLDIKSLQDLLQSGSSWDCECR